jgi:hypothetical protein
MTEHYNARELLTFQFCPHLYELKEIRPQTDLVGSIASLAIHRYIKSCIGTPITERVQWRDMYRRWSHLYYKHKIKLDELGVGGEHLSALMREAFEEIRTRLYKPIAVNYPLTLTFREGISVGVNVPFIATRSIQEDINYTYLTWLRWDPSLSRQEVEFITRIASLAISQTQPVMPHHHHILELYPQTGNASSYFIDGYQTKYHTDKTMELLDKTLDGMIYSKRYNNFTACMRCHSRKCKYAPESNNPRKILLPRTG